MARKKKNPTPSLLAGQPAPGSTETAPGSVPEKSTGRTGGDVAAGREFSKTLRHLPAKPAKRGERLPEGPDTNPSNPPKALRLADPAPRVARMTLRLVLDGEDAERLLRLTPENATAASAARHYLLSIIRDLDDDLINGPLTGEEPADPRRGLRLVGGRPARSSPRPEPPLPPCA